MRGTFGDKADRLQAQFYKYAQGDATSMTTQTKKDRRHYKTSALGPGCKLWPHCLTCPAPDCVWEIGASLKKQREIIEVWGSFFKEAPSNA